MFANLGLQYEKALWNKLMAMDDADFEAFVDEVNNMPSAERMNEVYPLEGVFVVTWPHITSALGHYCTRARPQSSTKALSVKSSK